MTLKKLTEDNNTQQMTNCSVYSYTQTESHICSRYSCCLSGWSCYFDKLSQIFTPEILLYQHRSCSYGCCVKVVCSGEKMYSRLTCHPTVMPVSPKKIKAACSVERALAPLCAIRGFFTKKDCASTPELHTKGRGPDQRCMQL